MIAVYFNLSLFVSDFILMHIIFVFITSNSRTGEVEVELSFSVKISEIPRISV